MTTLRSVVPDNIRAEMARRRVPQKTLAEALGITQQAVSQKLSGRRPLTDHEITVTARVLGVPAGDLFAEQVRAAS